jgi:hypothetical protein
MIEAYGRFESFELVPSGEWVVDFVFEIDECACARIIKGLTAEQAAALCERLNAIISNLRNPASREECDDVREAVHAVPIIWSDEPIVRQGLQSFRLISDLYSIFW